MSLRSALSLRQRLMLVVLLPAALLASSIAGVFIVRGTQAADSALRERGLAIVSFLAPAAEYGVISGNRNTLSQLIQAVMEQRDVAAVAIYDSAGTQMAVSGRPRLADAGRVLSVRQPQVMDTTAQRLTLAAPVLAAPLLVDDLDPGYRSGLENLPPVETGWVYVELDTEDVDSVKRNILITTLALALGVLALTTLLALRLANSVSGPVSRLAEAVGGITAGKLDVSVPDDAAIVELNALQRGFNQMAQSIADARHTLQAKVDEATALLAHQATHDPLTGLPNRRAFEQALEEAVSASRRAGDHGTLCFIDLDRFKIVNDTCGHAAGDELLRRIARLITQRVRNDDLICRIGGDEFALILRACSATEALQIAESLRESIAAYRFNWDGRRFAVGASVGLVRIDGGLDSASDVLVAADLACYAAKKSGRNRVIEHEHSAPGGADTQDAAGTPRDDGGIPYERLELHAQPITALRPGDPMPWHEVLLREAGTQELPMAPSAQLARFNAEDRGLELDLWLAERMLELLLRPTLPDAPASVESGRLSIELSASTLAGKAYLDGLAHLLKRHPELAGRIVLHCPAACVARNPDEALTFITRARKLGCLIALSQLDGGNSGLLARLLPDHAQIDLHSLIERYGLEAGCNLAQALCSAAAAQHIACIASGVDDGALRNSLLEYGFGHAQGAALAPCQRLII